MVFWSMPATLQLLLHTDMKLDWSVEGSGAPGRCEPVADERADEAAQADRGKE